MTGDKVVGTKTICIKRLESLFQQVNVSLSPLNFTVTASSARTEIQLLYRKTLYQN